MRSFAQVDLLILDEVGVQFGTEFEKVIITDIINRRYSDMRPTIIMSNLTSDELSEYLGARVVDRMYEGGGGVLAFDWESYRSKVAKDRDLPRGEYVAPAWMQVD
jgi:DNA replication protein DnaC